jgi:TetR/AcrR family transcriptional regulator, transcriptional repressor for nem operon
VSDGRRVDNTTRTSHVSRVFVHYQFTKLDRASSGHRCRQHSALGNVYYYFKTKDELGVAIVEQYLAQFQGLRQEWERADSPAARLQAYIQMTIDTREAIARSGCPIGTLCSELHKDGGTLAKRAMVLFAEPLAWIEAQFKALGKGSESRGLAVHLLSALQGAAVLAHSFGDSDLAAMEANRLKEWIRNLTASSEPATHSIATTRRKHS